MRTSQYLLAILLTVIFLAQIVGVGIAQEQVTLRVNRRVFIGSAYAYVIDVIKPSTPVNELKLYFPFDLYSDLYRLDVIADGDVTEEWFLANDSMVLKLTGRFTSDTPLKLTYAVISPSQSLNMTDTNTITITLPIAPIMDYPISKINARMDLPSWISEIAKSSPAGLISFIRYGNETSIAEYEAENITPLNKTMLSATFKGKEAVWVSAEELTRRIIIGLDGSIEIEDSYVLINRDIEDLEYWKPPDIKDFKLIEVKDKFGKLTYDKIKEKWVLRYFVKPGEKFQVTLLYKVENRSILEGSTAKLDFDLTEGVICAVKRFSATIILPAGSSLREISPRPDEHIPGDPPEYTYYFSKIVPNLGLLVKLSAEIPTYMGYIQMGSTLLLGVIAILLGVTAYLIYVKPKPIERPRVKIDISSLRDLLAEKYRILRKLDELEERYRGKRIKRHEYVQRRRALRGILSKIEGEIKMLRSKQRFPKRISKVLDELEELEAVLRSSKAALRELEDDYKAGRISRSTYTRIYTQRTRDIERTYARIDELVEMLGKEAEET